MMAIAARIVCEYPQDGNRLVDCFQPDRVQPIRQTENAFTILHMVFCSSLIDVGDVSSLVQSRLIVDQYLQDPSVRSIGVGYGDVRQDGINSDGLAWGENDVIRPVGTAEAGCERNDFRSVELPSRILDAQPAAIGAGFGVNAG